MELNKMIKMMAEKHAYFDGEQMDSTNYFSFIAGARYALQLIAKEINEEL